MVKAHHFGRPEIQDWDPTVDYLAASQATENQTTCRPAACDHDIMTSVKKKNVFPGPISSLIQRIFFQIPWFLEYPGGIE